MKLADWTTADEIDIDMLESGGHNESVVEEARKRMERKAQHKKWELKAREAEELRIKEAKDRGGKPR